jgi:hypothetical protein
MNMTPGMSKQVVGSLGVPPSQMRPGSRFPLQVRARRSSSLAGFPTAILFYIVMLVALCASCSHEQDVDKARWLDGISGSDTLFIKGHFDDCGEWGGHSEIIQVFRTKDGTMHAAYERDTVNCSDPALFNRRVIERNEADLNQEQQALIVSFIQELVERSFEETYGGHAGIAYVVIRTPLDSRGLRVVYVTGSKWPAFENLKKSLLSID